MPAENTMETTDFKHFSALCKAIILIYGEMSEDDSAEKYLKQLELFHRLCFESFLSITVNNEKIKTMEDCKKKLASHVVPKYLVTMYCRDDILQIFGDDLLENHFQWIKNVLNSGSDALDYQGNIVRYYMFLYKLRESSEKILIQLGEN